jgi:hypothetical protein
LLASAAREGGIREDQATARKTGRPRPFPGGRFR